MAAERTRATPPAARARAPLARRESRRGACPERVPLDISLRCATVTTELRLRELLDRLAAAEVRFVIVGGLAVNAWGHVRGTQDVDLVPDPDRDNLDRLASVLEETGGRVETAQGRLAASAIQTFLAAGDRTLVATDLGPVDILQGLPQIPPFSQLDAEAVAVDLGGTVVRVCSLEALLAMKRASDRPRDRDDLDALEAAHPSEEEEPDD